MTVVSTSIVSISVIPDTATIAKGTFKQFTAVANFGDGSTQVLTSGVSWKSSKPSVLSFRRNGLARGKRAGAVTITAVYGSLSATASVSVSTAQLVSMAITPADGSIPYGTKQEFSVIGIFSDGSSQDLTANAHWASSDGSAATISNGAWTIGLASSYAPGSTTISASTSALQATTGVTVTNASLVSLTVLPADPTILLGTSQQFTASGNFSDGTTQDITNIVSWSSSAPAVAVVSRSGLATSAATGETNIWATRDANAGNSTLTIE